MAWGHVQSAKNVLTTAANSITVTFGTTPTVGNKIIFATTVNFNSSGLTFTVVDGNSVALTQLVTPVYNATGTVYGTLFAYDVPATPSTTIKLSIATSGSYVSEMGAVAQEISGLLAGNTTAMLDGTVASSSGSVSSGSISGPTYSSTAANEYLAELFFDFGNGATLNTPSGYTGMDGENSSANADCLIAYKNSTNGSETASWSSSNTWGGSADDYVLLAAAFKLAAVTAVTPLPANVVSQAVNRSLTY